jgi:hypothetical protein
MRPISSAELEALRTLDVQAMRRAMGQEVSHLSDEGILIGMHKVRMHIDAVGIGQRRESLEWLRQRGYKGLLGTPLPNEIWS